MTSDATKSPGFWFLISITGSGIFIIQLVVFMVGPLLVSIANDLNVEVAVAGQLNTITAFVWLFMAFVAGYFSDRHGRRLILLIGLSCATAGLLGTALAPNFPAAMFFRAVTGLGGLIPPTCGALIADFVPTSKRGKGLGWMTAAGGMSVVVGIPIMTLIAEAASWRWSFGLAAAGTLLVLLLVLVKLPNPERVGVASGGLLSRFKPLARLSLIYEISFINVCQRIAFSAFLTYFAAYLIVTKGLSTGETALPMAIAGVGTVVSPAVIGYLSDTKHRLLIMPIGLTIGGITGLIAFQADVPLVVLVALGFVFTTTIFSAFPVFILLLSLIGGRRLRGTVMGIPPFSNQGGALLGPALGGLALSLGGYGAIGTTCVVVSALGVIVATLRVRERRVQEAIDSVATMET
ncbi:MAG: putative arabinose efflux permease, MFS family [Chloroflexi bacterium]|nr:MAG: putative arabinose efflux permease, MFS family [Chloroflexota bacterium]